MSSLAITTSINNYITSDTEKYLYIHFLKRTYKFLVLDYLKKYMRKKHSILNKALYIFDEGKLVENDNFVENIYSKILIERIFGDYFNFSDEEKQVINQKKEGHNTSQIAINTGYSRRKIEKILAIIKKKINYI